MVVGFCIIEKTKEKKVRGFIKCFKRGTALLLAEILILTTCFPHVVPMKIKAEEYGKKVILTSAQGDFDGEHKLYCIDKGGLAIWGIAAAGDEYECHKPTEAVQRMSMREQEYIFWGTLSLQALHGDESANKIIKKINDKAQIQGISPIGKLISEEDLKALIYSSSLRAKYPWLETVASNTKEYLTLAGLIGGSGGSTQSGKKIPNIIVKHTSLSAAYQIGSDNTIHFEENGADSDFIQKVPIEFEGDDGGWTYTKTSNRITFHNPNPQPPKATIKFVTRGTEYDTTGGTYASEQELFDQCLQIWECVTCSGTHTGGTPPASAPWVHQRMVWLDIGTVPVHYFASLPTASPTPEQGGGSPFRIFRHSEDFISTYNVQLYKYDSETGKPLEGARFVLYERFDDKDEIDKRKDGPIHIYAGGDPYASYHTDNPVIWDGFRKVGTVVTNVNGHGKKTIEHGYHYDKTFCNGHPAPVFVSVPEEEEDEETGEILNEDAIEAAKTQNRELAQEWEDCAADCRDKAAGDFEGVHFHWIMDDVNQGEIEAVSSQGGTEGETPDGGNTSEADAETAYERSGCFQDMTATYERFAALKYSYTFTEFEARDGYIRHDLHSEDLPIEIITTDSSENGANAFFAGEYSNKEALDRETSSKHNHLASWAKKTSDIIAETVKETKKEIISKKLYQKLKIKAQDIIACIAADVTEAKTAELTAKEDTTKTEPEKPDLLKPDPEKEETKQEETGTEETEKEETEQPETEQEKATSTNAASDPPAEISLRPRRIVYAARNSQLKTVPPFLFIDEEEDQAAPFPPCPSLRPATPADLFPSSPPAHSATPSVPVISATPSSAFIWPAPAVPYKSPRLSLASEQNERGRAAGSSRFFQAYEAARLAGSAGRNADPGPSGDYSHCNDRDREGNAWRVYDHRTEGEFHINKKDLDLAAGESERYHAYGDTQGDAVLEGALYGLFAAEEICHPDGRTGIVYRANNLVAVAATDKNGDASFLVNTEAPGRTYDYKAGCIVNTEDGWREKAPVNLYTADEAFDDYTEDGNCQRCYQNNEARNGNCWIGRPLLMGGYYVKELSRSEGYELSIGNKAHSLTNLGQDLDVKAPESADGYAVITQQLFADEQTSEDGKGAGPNELFFAARSKDTKDQRYDLILSGLPKGAEFYRKDTGTSQVEVTVGTGSYEKIFLTNPDGSPKYIRAEKEYQYPKYNSDQSLMMREIPVNCIAERFRQVSVRPLNAEIIQAVLNQPDKTMTDEENQEALAKPFSAESVLFVKAKTETALRRNGRATPRKKLLEGGSIYSDMDTGIFDRGVREGEADPDGSSGVQPGEPAACTVYGAPIQSISLAKQKPDGTDLTAGDAILSTLNYYDRSPYYSYGGIDEVKETADAFIFTIYASVTGNPDQFMVLGSDPQEDSIIFHAIKNDAPEAPQTPRLCYVPYSNNPVYDAFGTYENYREETSGLSVLGSAVLITDAVAGGDGSLHSKVIEENVYYQPGELVRDSGGKLIQAFEYREIVTIQMQEREEIRWQKIPASAQEDGTWRLSVDAAYRDSFGVSHTNEGADQTMEFKAVLKETSIILSGEDAALLGDGFFAGDPMNSASYYVRVKKARVKAYLDLFNLNLAGGNSYLNTADLVYPGQETIAEDAGTRDRPASVNERVIRQKIKLVKDLIVSPDGSYPHNTNADSGHRDEVIDSIAGAEKGAKALDNFRFKLYLKSNLERLYRDEQGEIIWLDRDGRKVQIKEYLAAYPDFRNFVSVTKLYTKVPHHTASLTAGSISNNVWAEAVAANESLYSQGADHQIKEEQNPGYTRLLETVTRAEKNEDGEIRQTVVYHYEKFFDAVKTANHDKWDAGIQSSTSFKPAAYIREKIFGTGGAQREYPAVHNNERTDNTSNTSEAAKINAQVSDAVRQFAVTWYLDEEVKKLTEGNGAGEPQPSGGSANYQEELYDQALYAAVKKALNYLKPFFSYDLDEIYSVRWDGEAAGGADGDRTTLEASSCHRQTEGDDEKTDDEFYYGISGYLPYGIYVAVEQQPFSAELKDFYNRHYQIDRPREVIVPSLYEPGGDENEPEQFHRAYTYKSTDTPQQLQGRYQLRFNREWADFEAGHISDIRDYVISARNHDGSFELYKYGLDVGRLNAGHRSSAVNQASAWDYQGFTIAQETADPYKDVYRSENPACIFKSNLKVGQYYRYGSLSEQEGVKEGVKTITGALTGLDGQYFSALVPWTVTEPVTGKSAADQLTGWARVNFHNTFYSTKLRIEKLDSETGEAILHDGALFAIYSADRETAKDGGGRVKFYKQDTVIAGSREFLEAMGAENITPTARLSYLWDPPYKGKYYGTVGAGTPICREEEQVILTDDRGKKTGRFRAFSATADVAMADPENGEAEIYGDQNTGYLETPEPLGAGCYVLAEIKAPSGYTKSRPIAIEVYSDQTAYYMDGNSASRILSVICEDNALDAPPDDPSDAPPDDPSDAPPDDPGQGRQDTARVYVNNTPIRLEFAKVKSDEEETAHELNGRLEGGLTELKEKYGLGRLELAYNASGTYLGYGWRRGFLENLKHRQAAGERIELFYEDGVFTGKAGLKRGLETADDENRYLPGALMTLYDAIKVTAEKGQEDYGYSGVKVKRDPNGNVTDMYVQKGYGGNQIKYVLEKTDPAESGNGKVDPYTYDDQEDDKGRGTWIGKTVEREDTDILFFGLGGLDVLKREKGSLYGYDAEGNSIQAKDGASIFALKSGRAFLEIICGDYENLHYNSRDQVFDRVPEGTEIYHLNPEGGRDSRVDPYTGMAYVVEETTGSILVWPVKISRDAHGNIIAREKIATGRIASIHADTENEYTIGTLDSAQGHFQKRMNPVVNTHGLPLYYQKSDEVYQKGSPVYDRDGDYIRYRYDDKLNAYNNNAYEIRQNKDLFHIGEDPENEGDEPLLYHRQGESLLIENTWLTGEKFPNDPFSREQTSGQADVLKRVPAGTYILEELEAPEGYVKTMPSGVTVKDTNQVQSMKATDRAITVLIDKIDAPEARSAAAGSAAPVLTAEESAGSTEAEPSGRYSFRPVEGAALALYKARPVRTDDTAAHPSGYYLEKTEETPAVWTVLDENNQPVRVTAQWITGRTPNYFEAIPEGFYILEETEAPSGYVRAAMDIQVRETGALQAFTLPNDHIKAEIFKYVGEDGNKKPLPNETPAELALYEAVTDEHGIVTENGLPVINEEKEVDRWETDDCREYTQITDMSKYKKKSLLHLFKREPDLSGFTFNYEALLNQYGPAFDSFTWEVERTASRSTKTEGVFLTSKGERIIVSSPEAIHFPEGMSRSDQEGFSEGYKKEPDALHIGWLAGRRAKRVRTEQTDRGETIRQLWETGEGKQTAICAVKTLTEEGKPGYVFDYRFHYKELGNPNAPNAVSYDTAAGTHRIDYLPLHENGRGYYVLAETRTPEGFKAVDPQPVIVEETAQLQLYPLKNEPNYLDVEKTDESGKAVKNARLSLYRAAEDGALVMDPEHLTASWLSGSDGKYTQEEIAGAGSLNGAGPLNGAKPPDGAKPGTLKPHRISPLPWGTYYLAEPEAPAGYEKLEPVKFTAAADSKPLIRAVNKIKKGIIKIEKTDADDSGKKLSGAEFEIKNLDTGETFTLITDENGRAESRPVTTGVTGEAGYFLFFRFRIQEIVPPDTYKLNLSVHDFQFTDQQTEAVLSYWYEISDEPTEIAVSKSDFNSSEPVKGARLAVYRAKESGGIYEAEGAALEEWISDGKPHVIRGKLSAGRSYLLKELAAPAGYTCAEPLLFTISDDGRKIVHVTNQRNKVWFQAAADFVDGVEAVTILGRQAIRTRQMLTNLDTGEEGFIPDWRTKPLTKEDGFQEGHLCEQREITCYSDGSSQISGRTIFRLDFGEDQSLPLKIRKPEDVICRIETKEGELIESWTVKNQAQGGFAHKIYNPEYEESCRIRVISSAGQHGSALRPGDIIKYEITCKNKTNKVQNIPVTVKLDPRLDFMPANSTGGMETDHMPGWIIRDVEPGACKSVIATAAVRPDTAGKWDPLITKADIGAETYAAVNPIAAEGSLSLINSISGTASDQLAGEEFTYRIELTDREGNPMKGLVPYTGAKEGVIKSGDLLTLKGGEAVTFTGMAWGTGYQIRQEAGYNAEVSIIGAEGKTGAEPVSAVFQNHRNDGSVRELFKKGETYVLIETTTYSDGEAIVSDKLVFTLNEQGAVGGLDMNDKPTHVILSKTEITGAAELPGAHLTLQDEAGALIDQWISTERPHELKGILEPGKTYTLTERAAPDGYAYSEAITFTVSGDGTVDRIRMEDRPTKAEILKIDSVSGKTLSGAHLQIRDLEGRPVEDWISSENPHRITGRLKAGQTYCLWELQPPEGYWMEEPIYFTVSLDGRIDKIVMEDRPIRLLFEKHGLSGDKKEDLGLIGEAVIQIRDQAGSVIVEFTTKEGEARELTGLLTAGETYLAVELQAPPGYELAEPVEFTVPEKDDGEELIVVRMDDRKVPKEQPDQSHPPEKNPPLIPPPILEKGYITASYERRLTGTGCLVIREGQLSGIPALGEGPDPRWAAGAGGISLGLALLFLKMARKNRGRREADGEKRRKED